MSNYQDVRDETFSVPFISKLTSALEPGQSFVIHGEVLPGATRFEINLINSEGVDPGDPNFKPKTIPLQVSFHFEVGITELNAFENGEWNDEECHSNPFFPEKPFDVRIRVHEDKFEVMANQKHLAYFHHHIDYKSIDFLQINGDVKLMGIRWGGRYFQMPFETAFHGHAFENGQRVFIQGMPKGDFAVSFLGQQGDVLFHVQPKLDQHMVVFNTKIDDKWGIEEQHRTLPFKFGEAFDLVIQNEAMALQVFVNGEYFYTFYHRTNDPQKDYKLLRIDGDMELTDVEVSICWETVGGLANCCGFLGAGASKQRDQLGEPRIGIS